MEKAEKYLVGAGVVLVSILALLVIVAKGSKTEKRAECPPPPVVQCECVCRGD